MILVLVFIGVLWLLIMSIIGCLGGIWAIGESLFKLFLNSFKVLAWGVCLLIIVPAVIAIL